MAQPCQVENMDTSTVCTGQFLMKHRWAEDADNLCAESNTVISTENINTQKHPKNKGLAKSCEKAWDKATTLTSKKYIVRKEIKGTVLVQLDLSAYFWNGDYSKESSSKATLQKNCIKRGKCIEVTHLAFQQPRHHRSLFVSCTRDPSLVWHTLPCEPCDDEYGISKQLTRKW